MDFTWITLAIILIGIFTVVGGILIFRLHAFIALILGAILVALLTPSTSIERHVLAGASVDFRIAAPEAKGIGEAEPPPGRVLLPNNGPTGVTTLDVVRLDPSVGHHVSIGMARVDASGTHADFYPAESLTTLEANDLLVPSSILDRANELAGQTVGERVATGFGTTCAKIGILIAFASIIGKCLLDSGAADRIVRSAMGLLGERRAGGAFLGSGFLLGIPVFFDTVFYLMIPLGKAMRMRTGRNYLFYVLTITAGATMAHSLVPPTPGPLFVAEALGVDIGLMILAGIVVGIFTAGTGYLYASVLNRHCELPLRDTPEFSLEELERLAQRDENTLPPLFVSLLPILLPVVLIGGMTVINTLQLDLSAGLTRIIQTFGNKNIALLLAAGIAMATVAWQKRTSLRDLGASIEQSLASGGVIILITAGGGAFGLALQQTGVAGLIDGLPSTSPALIVTFAFLITTAVRTAQGSATVAMITAVGILSGLTTSGNLPFHPVYLALAIGCGSKPIAWMNDSGFWVIARMSGMSEREALKYVTPMSILMGLTGLLIVVIGVTLFPLV